MKRGKSRIEYIIFLCLFFIPSDAFSEEATIIHSYDDIGRLKSVYYNKVDQHETITYRYDEIGNFVQYNESTFATDTDQDGLPDILEEELGTNPNNPDSDNDGISDGEEYNQTYTDPTLNDTDGDGILDGTEIANGTDPRNGDSDFDGMLDSEEDLDSDGEVDSGETDPMVTDLYISSLIGDDYYGLGTKSAPWGSIRHAIDQSHGAENIPVIIHVAAGTYPENITLDSYESLEGGWNTDFSQRSPQSTSDLYLTVIDAGAGEEYNRRGITIDNLDGFLFIDGFTIQNGQSVLEGGGGILVRNSNVEIRNCTMNNNEARYGGALAVIDGEMTLRDSTIADNSASFANDPSGGGIYNDSGKLLIENSLFFGNSVSGGFGNNGGAIYNKDGSLSIYGSSFSGNSVSGKMGQEERYLRHRAM